MKPLSTYPEDRAAMLKLCDAIDEAINWYEPLRAGERLAGELADVVRAILEDEAVVMAGRYVEEAAAKYPVTASVLADPGHHYRWCPDAVALKRVTDSDPLYRMTEIYDDCVRIGGQIVFKGDVNKHIKDGSLMVSNESVTIKKPDGSYGTWAFGSPEKDYSKWVTHYCA